jgi:hypothetical protein
MSIIFSLERFTIHMGHLFDLHLHEEVCELGWGFPDHIGPFMIEYSQVLRVGPSTAISSF